MTTDADAELERKIEVAVLRCSTATNPNDRRRWWNELKRLHALRSPEQIERMERKRGLHRSQQ